ncbi:DHBP synthase RibB-like alpha/beta domain-containing protein [Echria macrotheca]|uniref:Threonylcarbamoyl-AMP synthase n=1 Tax=Echria macrotheca TaxID=438768 RepID=A0AAJ0FB22_9PEZI|nr:DHBP synthase RibB-like alpha/beta domain-containing protein [Echria macrotheca]
MKTKILPVPVSPDSPSLGHWASSSSSSSSSNASSSNGNDVPSNLEEWQVPLTTIPPSLLSAATALRTTPVPVAFPTETVYGLGADATRSAAVRGIYTAKGRPSDNPLIVHVADLAMLRSLLSAPIPPIYLPLIKKFWPGPLTILLPVSADSQRKLAPEVTAGLPTFGARMPASPLARTLIKLAGAPLAAPSANASTKPSPTTAQHVLDDLDGRIEVILDGGPCAVGVESTVVDGLCEPPAVLRPGGVSIEELRACRGWEGVVRAYRDADAGEEKPRAPGMKYKHYSPRARVVLFEGGDGDGKKKWQGAGGEEERTVGVIRTGRWEVDGGWDGFEVEEFGRQVGEGVVDVREGKLVGEKELRLLDVDLTGGVKAVAHGLFAALRELDRLGADVILVEGVDDGDDIAAAVMNRLRKAASEIRRAS